MIDPSEIEDFNKIIESNGFEPNDFKYLIKEDTVESEGIFPLTGSVKITCTSNGHNRTYKAGHRSAWPSEFAADLESGVFGSAI